MARCELNSNSRVKKYVCEGMAGRQEKSRKTPFVRIEHKVVRCGILDDFLLSKWATLSQKLCKMEF